MSCGLATPVELTAWRSRPSPAASRGGWRPATLWVVDDLAASPDGAWVATAGADGAMRLTNVESGETREIDRSRHDAAAAPVVVPGLEMAGLVPRGRQRPRQPGPPAADTPGRGGHRHGGGGHAQSLCRHRAGVDARRPLPGIPVSTGVRPCVRPGALRSRLPRRHPSLPPAPGGGQPGAARAGAGGPRRWRRRRVPSEGPVAVAVDTEGLAERLVDLPVAAGRLSGLAATRRGLVWLEHPSTGELGEGRVDPDEHPKAQRPAPRPSAPGRSTRSRTPPTRWR